MSKRKLFDYVIITLKGMAMGAADVVPGVSGGTIAFISGIYDELLDSINAISFNLFKTLKNEGIKVVWQRINGNFLFSLLLGIGISVISLAKLLSNLLMSVPVLVWSFFFGLVLASIYFVGKQIKKWDITRVIFLLIGSFFAFYITQIPGASGDNPSSMYLVLSGALAICAMILPGISGSFILVLLGVYQVVLTAVHQREFSKLFYIGLGAFFGLLSFARLLKFIFSKYRDTTLAVLTGFIIGALYKIWPWKKVLETKVFEGKTIVTKEVSISPFSFEGDPMLGYALLLALFGFLVIIILERWGTQKQ